MRKLLLSLLSVMALLVVAPSVLATTTIVNFDTTPNGAVIVDGTAITTQYASVGVTASGTTAVNAALNGQLANTPPNIAYTPSGTMTFNLVIPNIQSVSLYLTAPANVGIFAYDAANNLVGQAVTLSTTGRSDLFSITSSGQPIARVEIRGPSASFFVDTVTFSTTPDIIPIANAGHNRGGEVGERVTLNGSKSYDPDTPPQPLKFQWTQVSGPATVTLTGATTARPSFTPSVSGVYLFSLVVSDDLSSSKPSTVTVKVEPAVEGCFGCNPFIK